MGLQAWPNRNIFSVLEWTLKENSLSISFFVEYWDLVDKPFSATTFDAKRNTFGAIIKPCGNPAN